MLSTGLSVISTETYEFNSWQCSDFFLIYVYVFVFKNIS